jgi:putative DNA primase/helicase
VSDAQLIIQAAPVRALNRLDGIGNGERFADQHRDHARYVPEWRSWVIWDGTRWRPDLEDVAALGLAKTTARRIFDEITFAGVDLASLTGQIAGWNGDMPGELAEQRDQTDKHVKALIRHAVKSSSAPALRDMLKLAQSEGVSIGVAQLDSDSRILNTPSGIVDLETGELHPHAAEKLCTKITTATYNMTATAPRWAAFLEMILRGDQELVQYVQRLAGLALTGNPGERILPILHGPGGTGKSTFANVLRSVLGDYATTGNGEALLLTRRGAGPDEDLADLIGRRLVILPELPAGKVNAPRIKRLTGGDAIRTHKKFGHVFEFEPTHTFFVFTNDKPEVDDHSSAMWDRLRVVPFEHRIPNDVKKSKIEAEAYLLAEAPGILTWAVKGAIDYCRDGLGSEPKSVTIRTAAYQEGEDVIGQFLADRCIIEAEGWESSKDLHAACAAWGEANGEKPIATRTLTKKLGERGFPARSKRIAGVGVQRGIQGLTLLHLERNL